MSENTVCISIGEYNSLIAMSNIVKDNLVVISHSWNSSENIYTIDEATRLLGDRVKRAEADFNYEYKKSHDLQLRLIASTTKLNKAKNWWKFWK